MPLHPTPKCSCSFSLTGRGQKLNPGDAEEAASSDDEEMPEGGREPPFLLNGTTTSVWNFLLSFLPSSLCVSLVFPLNSLFFTVL